MGRINSPFSTILFDVDNTLYDAECGVETEMSRRIDEFVSDYLGVTKDESRALRAEYLPVYGTTLRWLQVCHNMTDTGRYMNIVHPVNLEDYIDRNHQLREMLQSLTQNLVVFTNGPEFHARRVLKTLGIEDLFTRFFALEHMGFQGKPCESAYKLVLDSLKIKAEETLFLDDKEVNLDAFHRMGGFGLLVGQGSATGRYPQIRTILELKDYLEQEVLE